jgi:hypothetical protein
LCSLLYSVLAIECFDHVLQWHVLRIVLLEKILHLEPPTPCPRQCIDACVEGWRRKRGITISCPYSEPYAAWIGAALMILLASLKYNGSFPSQKKKFSPLEICMDEINWDIEEVHM